MSAPAVHDPDLDLRVKKGKTLKLIKCKRRDYAMAFFFFIATERISENMHIVANEPSLAFYRLQEHVRKVMPAMVQKRVEVTALHQDLQGCCYDIEYSLT